MTLSSSKHLPVVRTELCGLTLLSLSSLTPLKEPETDEEAKSDILKRLQTLSTWRIK